MKELMEEYGNTLLAIMITAILLAFLYSGFRDEGWLRVLLISYMTRTYGG